MKILQREHEKKTKVKTETFDDMIFSPIILKHIFAREYGWSHEQSNKLTLEDAMIEFEMIMEDKRRERKNAIQNNPKS